MKVLFVGDDRDLNNYGSIATTEALLNILGSILEEADVKYITGRQILAGTCKRGIMSDLGTNNFFSLVKKIFVSVGIMNKIRRLVNNLCVQDDLPLMYCQYEQYEKAMYRKDILNEELELLTWADIVIINGEGYIVNGTDKTGFYRRGGRYILFLAYMAKKMNKTCYIVNHTVDPQNYDVKEIIQKLYPRLDGVYVREKKSLELLKQWGIEHASYVPDALWSHDFEKDVRVQRPLDFKEFDFTEDYICIGDSSGIYNQYGGVQWNVTKVYNSLIAELKKICPRIIFIDGFGGGNTEINQVIRKNKLKSIDLNNCNYSELYFVLKHSCACVSGRWHTSIIALLAGTPIVTFGADSHKTEALYGEVNYKYRFFDIKSLPLATTNVANEVRLVMEQDMSVVMDEVNKLKEQAENYSFCYKNT